MKFLTKILTVLLAALLIPAAASARREYSTEPITNDQARWRVGFYQGGDYVDYSSILIATTRGLMESGWLPKKEIPFSVNDSTKDIWMWLSKQDSPYIRFIVDAFYSAEWESKNRSIVANKIIGRLNLKRDIDLMLATGTWAGKDLANNRHHTPLLVLTASDPVAAGIVKNDHYSGYNHVWAHTTPKRHERQIEIFHDIFKFKRLGIIYEDTREGRSYAAVDKVAWKSRELGFDLVRCHSVSDIPDEREREAQYLECLDKIIDKVDALYIAVHGGVDEHTIPEIVRQANEHGVPTFSQSGAIEVKLGVLLSMSHKEFFYEGEFYASIIAKVFNGAKPGKLDQVFEGPPKLAINLKTAKAIGFEPPLLLIGAADEVYDE